MGKRFAIHERIKHYSIATESLEYSTLILRILNKFMKTLNSSKKTIDEDTQKLLDEIETLSEEQAKKAKIESELLALEKDNYNIDDFNNAYKKENEILNLNKNTK